LRIDRRDFLKTLGGTALYLATVGSLSPMLSGCKPSFKEAKSKVVIIGFDGVEPTLFEKYLEEGHFPNMERLIKMGSYNHLMTTNPSESPVCWTSFAVGANPGWTGIYDFLRRDPMTYMPIISTVEKEPAKFLFDLIPIKRVKITSLRKGISFWEQSAINKIKTTAFQVPCTFPAFDMRGGKMMSGLDVPDIRGTQGTYQYYATDITPEEAGSSEFGGLQHKISVINNTVRSYIEGPQDPTKEGFHPIRIPVTFTIDGETVIVDIQGNSVRLREGRFTDWVVIKFQITPLVSVTGIAKFVLISIKPELRIFLTPIDISPINPPIPICSPDNLTTELAKQVGLFRTRGWAINNMALTEERIDEEIFLEELFAIEDMRKRLTLKLIDNDPSDLFISVFQATDRVGHAFYRLIDTKHPKYDEALAQKYGDAILRVYKHMDGVVGEIMKRLPKDATLIILSDHGFHSFRRSVNINTWLVRNNFMTLKGDINKHYTLNDLFGKGEFWPNVDWFKTRAYALGLGQIYINLVGRESKGTVLPGRDYQNVVGDIAQQLGGLIDDDGTKVIHKVYKRDEIFSGDYVDGAPDLQVGFEDGYRVSWQTCLGGIPKDVIEPNNRKWSGDHCSLEPSITNGILLSNKKINGVPKIIDIAPTALKLLGVPLPKNIEGTSLF
jgi:predicted AlkP superfamily phosphohydrolase/phosphomutase